PAERDAVVDVGAHVGQERRARFESVDRLESASTRALGNLAAVLIVDVGIGGERCERFARRQLQSERGVQSELERVVAVDLDLVLAIERQRTGTEAAEEADVAAESDFRNADR